MYKEAINRTLAIFYRVIRVIKKNKIYFFCVAFCGCIQNSNKPQSSYKEMHQEKSENTVKNYFIKNNWTYPLHIDTTITVDYYVKNIVNNKREFAIKAYDSVYKELQHRDNAGYVLKNARIYTNSNKIYYSLSILVCVNNYLKPNQDSEFWGHIDNDRILAAGNVAVFEYKNSNIYFLEWGGG